MANRLADILGGGEKSDDPAVNTDDPTVSIGMGTTGSDDPKVDLEMGGDVVAETMASLAPIRLATELVKRNTATAKKLLDRQVKAATNDEKKAISQTMDGLSATTNKAGMEVKALVTTLGDANIKYKREHPGSSTGIIRSNLLSQAIRDYQDAISDFEKASEALRTTTRGMLRTDLRRSGLTDEKKIDAIIDSGDAQRVIQESISGDLSDVIEGLEARHSSILALERSVRDVQRLFIDLAAIVNQQQEHIDNIAKSIEHTVDYVERGEKHLNTAAKDQDTARKRQCCIVIIVVVVLFVVVGIPLLKTFT